VLALLRHPEPAVRADACRCARPGPETAEVLIDLANDLNPDVAMAALCALGGMGRTEARPALKRLIREAHPFVIAMLLLILILSVWPRLALWLPALAASYN
jgi:HEAT repeat protein